MHGLTDRTYHYNKPPDRWVVITIQNPKTGEKIDKLLMGNYGGFFGSDTWQLNSGIEHVEVFDQYIEIYGYSGSIYRCWDWHYGTTYLTASIITQLAASGNVISINEEYEPYVVYNEKDFGNPRHSSETGSSS